MLFLYARLCVVKLYLSEALPSCGCVCQGDKLLLHLINPFFNPMGQSKAHKQSCNTDATGLEETSQTLCGAIKLSEKLSYIHHWTRPSGHTAWKQRGPERIAPMGSGKMSTNHRRNRQEQIQHRPIKCMSLNVNQCDYFLGVQTWRRHCEQWRWCEWTGRRWEVAEPVVRSSLLVSDHGS